MDGDTDRRDEAADNLASYRGTDGDAQFRITRLADGTSYVQATCHGSLTAAELVEAMAHMAQQPGFDISLPTLWDLRAHEFGQTSAQKTRSVVFALGRLPERQGAKRAFVVGSEDGFGTMRLFQQSMEGFGIDTSETFLVTYDQQEALDWLAR
ncbi:hypothetical protein [Tropicibacter alexandrii]|uniref:hypothetical protein n=1 Tax=Tropicibacter alexandrii TaxID=2267683 RepID=UPI000EF45FC8|nr:hypothetical protein [Tropicibacter alexandrii]